jgi:hypothetical protein
MRAKAARAATSERCRARLQPCRPAPVGARRGCYGRAQNRRAIRRNSGRGMAAWRARAPGRARPATRDRCVWSVTAPTVPGNLVITRRTSSPGTRARRTRARRIAEIATTRRSSAKAATSRRDSSRRRESARRVTTTLFAASAWDTGRPRGRASSHARPATRSATARRVIPPLAVASDSTPMGPASTPRGSDRRTLPCVSRVMAARYRKASKQMWNCRRHAIREATV